MDITDRNHALKMYRVRKNLKKKKKKKKNFPTIYDASKNVTGKGDGMARHLAYEFRQRHKSKEQMSYAYDHCPVCMEVIGSFLHFPRLLRLHFYLVSHLVLRSKFFIRITGVKRSDGLY
jgi:hypothetical protein